jgi:hypothetical protein
MGSRLALEITQNESGPARVPLVVTDIIFNIDMRAIGAAC